MRWAEKEFGRDHGMLDIIAGFQSVTVCWFSDLSRLFLAGWAGRLALYCYRYSCSWPLAVFLVASSAPAVANQGKPLTSAPQCYPPPSAAPRVCYRAGYCSSLFFLVGPVV